MLAKSIAASLLLGASALKVGVVSDLHLNPVYDPTTSKKSCGRKTTFNIDSEVVKKFVELTSSDNAPLARLGCDATHTLVDYVLQTLKKLDSDVDFITLNGDLIGHGIGNNDPTVSSPDQEQEIRDIHA